MTKVFRVEQVTAEWLSEMLGTRIDRLSHTPIGTGQVGATYRFTLAGAGAPATLVGKFAATDDVSRATGVAQNSYKRETGFYDRLARGKSLPVPEILYVGFDEATHDFALIMREIAGARAGDQLVPLTQNEAETAVDALAAVHGAFWADATLNTRDWLPGSAKLPHGTVDPLYAMLWPAFLERYGACVTPAMREAGDALVDRVDAWIACGGSKTLVHGDYRHDNLLFDPQGGVTIVDWQTCAVGRGVRDLAYFAGTSLSPNDRRAWERVLFDRWLSAIKAETEADTEWVEYRRSAFAGFLMAVAASMIVGRTERGDAMFLTMGERAAAMVLDLGSINLI
ncbi:hypothetical protein SPAN111604_12210 [Sphingomonas antarctica]|uniref:phosphotransferase family protein n=1 Tax=Sphingomonas antarctica TaxID=2040274 RepID=UPI0039E8DE8C